MHARMHVKCIKRGEKFLSYGKQLRTFKLWAIFFNGIKTSKRFSFQHISWSSTILSCPVFPHIQTHTKTIHFQFDVLSGKCCVLHSQWLDWWLRECTALWYWVNIKNSLIHVAGSAFQWILIRWCCCCWCLTVGTRYIQRCVALPLFISNLWIFERFRRWSVSLDGFLCGVRVFLPRKMEYTKSMNGRNGATGITIARTVNQWSAATLISISNILTFFSSTLLGSSLKSLFALVENNLNSSHSQIQCQPWCISNCVRAYGTQWYALENGTVFWLNERTKWKHERAHYKAPAEIAK